jgi:ABC-type branched-subunit amino acid transport system substrate-binding protein
VETTIYVNSIVRSVGEDGTVALVVTDDPEGQEYANSFATAASDTNLTIVDRQLLPADNIVPPSSAVLVIASKRPAAIAVALSGAACATFLTELAKARAATEGWEPLVYMSGECADTSILGLAGDAADGVLTSANLVSDSPDFVATMQERGLQNGYALAAEGWTAAEVTVAIVAEAQRSSEGLTRRSIIDAARNLSYTPSLARPGVHYVTNGADDPFPAESLQIIRFDSATHSFVDVGPLIAQFES